MSYPFYGALKRYIGFKVACTSKHESDTKVCVRLKLPRSRKCLLLHSAISPLLVLLVSPSDQRECVRAAEAMKECYFDCSRPGQVSVMDPVVTAGEEVCHETLIPLKCGI